MKNNILVHLTDDFEYIPVYLPQFINIYTQIDYDYTKRAYALL